MSMESHDKFTIVDKKRRRESDETTCLAHDSKKAREIDIEAHHETDPKIQSLHGHLKSNMATTMDTFDHDKVKSAILDPDVLKQIAMAVSAAVKADFSQELIQIKTELTSVNKKLIEKDDKISELQKQVEDLQQYSRRNGLRISGIPEKPGEDTDKLVIDLAKELDVKISIAEISRSHRVGPPGIQRPILVKFTGYRKRNEVIRARSKLKGRPGPTKVYINEDLSRQRAKLAARARQMKKDGRITDSWTADSTVFIKLRDGTTVKRATTDDDIEQLIESRQIR
jgi:hypothetical protein